MRVKIRNAFQIPEKLRSTRQEQLQKHDAGACPSNEPTEYEDIASRGRSLLRKQTYGDAKIKDQDREEGWRPCIEKSEIRHSKCDPPPPFPSIQCVECQENADGNHECDKSIPARFGGKTHMPRVDRYEPGCKRSLPCQAETRRKKTYRAHDEDARRITRQPSSCFVELQARRTCEGSARRNGSTAQGRSEICDWLWCTSRVCVSKAVS